MQRRTCVKRKQGPQLIDGNRLIRWIELDLRDRATLEILRRGIRGQRRPLFLGRRDDDGGQQQHEKHRRTHVPQ